MKKIISIFLAMAMLLCSFALFACEQEGESSSESSSSESSSSEESSSEQSSLDPADVVDPDAPENQELTLFANGSTDYKIIYDFSDTVLGTYVDGLVDFILEEHGASIDIKDKDDLEGEHEIIIGNVRENAQFIVNKLYENNDFAISVCGDDIVLYATSERLYPYLFAIAEELLGADNATFTPENSFIYHKSTYKSTPYAGYLKLKNGNISSDMLASELFEARTFIAEDGTELPYRIYIPSSYNEDEAFPVVTILHGAGERGSDNKIHLNSYVPELFSQANSPYWNAIVICPQCPSGQQWVDTPWGNGNYSTESVKQSNELTAVLEILDQLESTYSTDTNRYYVTGLSMGGFGTWDLIMRHPDRFAAAIPICGGADVEKASVLVNKPIWTFHGSADTTVPYKGTSDMVNAIKSAASDAGVTEVIKFTPLGSQGHTIWSQIGMMGMYAKWMFSQSLEVNN